jgi:nitroimidazol reductase NimA-like FMN-containing flavoprotein (pyridoxamine 5'-phosphate oxidase superfamily)
MSDRELIKKWLASHQYCVIATCVGNKPWAATVDYISDDKFNVYISTNPASLKFKNILKNPIVSLVIDSQGREGTLQIQGKVIILTGEPFKEPNLMIKPEFMVFRKKNEETGKVVETKLKI